ncbi:PREDICTED: acid phosphatase 1-like [Tarenaya hassleriana]|uniref:acid phosphatase 1-like n=1 Tax=Tarenaya hassleriana TaxID=28532 RepID=UPI00053C97EE|nr:PREDICTED: acid phosphatase 1-like [Tarenaya hassleriana]
MMASPKYLMIFPLIVLLMIPPATPLPRPGVNPKYDNYNNDLTSSTSYCESWKLAIETNNAGAWGLVRKECVDFVRIYISGKQYYADYELIADYAIDFAHTVKPLADGKDAWFFDVDETLLSHLSYFATQGYGTEPMDEGSFYSWIEMAKAPAFDASLRLYNELKKLGFTIFLLTGRDEEYRNATETNLLRSGYFGWQRLFLRGPEDKGKPATIYKSERRSEIVKEGYRIHGNVGDQWSDLLGFAQAERSFKVPNPLYYVP